MNALDQMKGQDTKRNLGINKPNNAAFCLFKSVCIALSLFIYI